MKNEFVVDYYRYRSKKQGPKLRHSSDAFTPFFSKKFVTDFEKIRHFYGFYLNFSKTRQKITNPPMSGPRENIYYHKNSQKQK